MRRGRNWDRRKVFTLLYLHPGLLLSWECVWHFTMVSCLAAPHHLSPIINLRMSTLPSPLLLPFPPSHTHTCSPTWASFSLLWLSLAAGGERLPTRIVHCVPTLILANLHRWTQSGRCSSPIPSLGSKYWNEVMLLTVWIGAQHKDWFLSLIFMR